jgi:hypothetical protein
MQLGELCERLGVGYRHARYVLEENILPAGVDPAPERGNHRQLDDGQAFWLGIVLTLKESGFKTPLAAEIANLAREGIRTLSQALSWDSGFRPFDGLLNTEYQWIVEISDLKHIRIQTSAEEVKGKPYVSDWFLVGSRRAVKNLNPVVTIRLDLSRLAQLLK